MAKSSALGMLMWFEGSLLSGDVGAINNLSTPRQVLPATGINSYATERLLGPADVSMELMSYFNDAAGQEHLILSALPKTDVVILVAKAAATPAVGDPAWGFIAKQVNYDVTRNEDGSMTVVVNTTGNLSPLDNLLMLTAGEDTVASGAAEGTSLDNAASTSGGGIGYLAVREIQANTAAIKVEDSADNSSWATLISFAENGSGAPNGERKTVTGTVDRYLHNDVASGGTNLDFAMAFRRGLAVDDVDLS
tara:strand:- start:651 stop:1400 length:750 start_codon:yes stop_codon:yes gene_type:complete